MRRFGTFLTLLGLSSCLVLKSHAHRVHGHRTPWLPWYTKEKEIAKPGVIAPHEDSPQLVQPGRSSASRFGVSLPTDNLTKFEGCPATSSTSFNTDRQRRTAVSHPHASSDVSSEKDEGDNLVTVGARRSSAACGAGQVPLSEVGFGSAPKVTCCPADKLECAGCSSFANGACAKCLPGYVKQCAAGKDTCGPVVCTACSDIPGYTDSDGKSCSQLCPATPKLFSQTEKNAFVAKATGGLTAMDACCACGGGLRDPTPWAYNDDVDFVLGKPVKVTPMPRTATAYAPDGCELEKYGLSLDPVTGVIEGSPLATEPFSLECKVTALQSPELGISYNATMKVRVLPFAYGRANLLLGSAALPVVSSRTYNAGKFGIKCSPTVSWLDQTGFAQAGQIKLAAEAGVKTGGLAGTAIETTASEHLKGVNSTLTGSLLVEKPSTRCHLTAERNAPTKGGKTTVMTDAADMVLIRSAPWTDIVYPVPFPAASPLLLTVGKPVEAPKILRPTDAAGNRNTMPPAFFTISCALKGTTTAVTEHVARTHEVNFVTASKSRIPLFTMDPVSGEIGGATSSKANGGWELPFKYVDAAQRGLVELECKIFGSELTASKPTGPAGPLPTSAWLAASKTVSITVQDDSCWQDVQVKSDSVFLTAYTQASAHQSLEACRRTCGTDASCALFNFSSNKCYKGRRSSKPGAARAALIDVQAKLSACDPSKTCKALEVQGHAWLSGTFCPVVRDFTAGSFMFAYQKTGFTPQDATYLYPYVAAREGTPAPCPAGSKWIVRQASGGDFLDPEGGQFTFRGRLLACLPPENTKGKWATGTGSIYMPPDFTKTSSKFLISMTPQICKSPLADLANAQSKDAQGAQQGQSAAAEEQTGGAPAGGGSPGEVYRIHDPDIEGPTGAASHWLDPCECFPVEWGPNAPVNPQVFSMLPRDGVNKIPKLTAKPQLIVKGSVTCMWKDLLSSFPTDSEEECSAKCREAAQCNFFWVGTMGAAPQCRLFSVCDALMSEPGNEQEMVSGALFGLPRYDVCLMADPQACAARTKRRKYLTSDDAESVSAPSFRVLCERFTKAEASHACKAQGMILAQVTSPLQNDWAVTALSSLCSAVTPWGWIDGSDAGHEGTWKFSDGTPQVYNNYNAGEPNGRTTENCNLLNVNSKWYDITCSYGGAAAVCMNTPKRLKAVCQSTTPNAAAAKCHAVGMKVATISTTADLENAQTVLASQCAGANGVAVIDGTNEGGGVAEYYTSDARTWSAPRWKAGHPKAGGGHCARLNVDGMESTPCTTASPAVLCQHDLSGLAFLPQSATAQLSSWDANHDKRGLSFKAPPLHHAWAWCGKFGGHGWHEWVEIGMPKAMWVSAIATRGRADWDQWVTAYRVEYLEAGGFVKLRDDPTFSANRDRNGIVVNFLPDPVFTQKIRIFPQAVHGHKSFRAMVLGPADSLVTAVLQELDLKKEGQGQGGNNLTVLAETPGGLWGEEFEPTDNDNELEEWVDILSDGKEEEEAALHKKTGEHEEAEKEGATGLGVELSQENEEETNTDSASATLLSGGRTENSEGTLEDADSDDASLHSEVSFLQSSSQVKVVPMVDDNDEILAAAIADLQRDGWVDAADLPTTPANQPVFVRSDYSDDDEHFNRSMADPDALLAMGFGEGQNSSSTAVSGSKTGAVWLGYRNMADHWSGCALLRGHNFEFYDRQTMSCPHQQWLYGFHVAQHHCGGNDMRTRAMCRQNWQFGACHWAYTQCDVGPGHRMEYLDRHNVWCGANYATNWIRLTGSGCPAHRQRFQIHCCYHPGIAAGQTHNWVWRWTGWNVAAGQQMQYMDRHAPACWDREVMRGFLWQRSGNNMRVGLVCQRVNDIVNGGFSHWSAYTACTRTCGTGTKTRTRTCNNPAPAWGGANCAGATTQTINCNTHNCPIHGRLSAWSTWSMCSRSCGMGQKVRTRTCSNPAPAYGGNDCSGQGETIEILSCNPEPCPSHCLFEREILECEHKLLLGARDIEECGTCAYLPFWFGSGRKTARPLPPTFHWGTQVEVSCWNQRYTLVDRRNDRPEPSFSLTCVDGSWIDPYGSKGFSNFECASCVQVGDPSLAVMEEQGKDELYFADRLPSQLLAQSSKDFTNRVAVNAAKNALEGQVAGTGTLPGKYLFTAEAQAADDTFNLGAAGSSAGTCAARRMGVFQRATKTCSATDIDVQWTAPALTTYAVRAQIERASIARQTGCPASHPYPYHHGSHCCASMKDGYNNRLTFTSNTCSHGLVCCPRGCHDFSCNAPFFRGTDKVLKNRMVAASPFENGAGALRGIHAYRQMSGHTIVGPYIISDVWTAAAGVLANSFRLILKDVWMNGVHTEFSCRSNEVMQDLRVNPWDSTARGAKRQKLRIEYECVPVTVPLVCEPKPLDLGASEYREDGWPLMGIERFGNSARCGDFEALQSLSMDVADKMHVVTGSMTCCKVPTPSVGLQPLPHLYFPQSVQGSADRNAFGVWEGVYCPARRDATGRLVFDQKKSWGAPGREPDGALSLAFSESNAKWCLSPPYASKCLVSEAAHPAEAAVTDPTTVLVDGVPSVLQAQSGISISVVGDFEAAQPKSKEEGKEMRPKPKKPKKPPPPSLVQLQPFNMEDEYTPYCRAETPGKSWPLVKDMSNLANVASPADTTFGTLAKTAQADGSFVFGEQYDPNKSSQSAIESNPCGYALFGGRKETPEINGKAFVWAQDLGTDASGINFDSVLGCFGREDSRDLSLATLQYGLSTADRIAEHIVLPLAQTLICTAPNTIKTVAAPVGIGVELDLGSTCDTVFDVLGHVRESLVGQMEDNADLFAENAGINDCNSGIHSFAKIMCDLACIQDAVRAGNTAVLNRLEEVFRVLQTNVLMMMNYHATNTESLIDWLASLLNWHGDNLAQKIAASKCPVLSQCPSLSHQIHACNHTAALNLPSEAGGEERTWTLVDCVMEAAADHESGAKAPKAVDHWRAALQATRDLRDLLAPTSSHSLRQRLERSAASDTKVWLAKAESAAVRALESVMQKGEVLRKGAEGLHSRLSEGIAVREGGETDASSLKEGDRKTVDVLAEAVGAQAELSAHVQRELAALKGLLLFSNDSEQETKQELLMRAAAAPDTSDEFGELLSASNRGDASKLLDMVGRSHEKTETTLASWEGQAERSTSVVRQFERQTKALLEKNRKAKMAQQMSAKGGEGKGKRDLEDKVRFVLSGEAEESVVDSPASGGMAQLFVLFQQNWEQNLEQFGAALHSIRAAVGSAVSAARAQMREEAATREELHAYLSCEEGSGFERLLPVWEALQRGRVKNGERLVDAWKQGASALDSLQRKLSVSEMEKQTVESDVRDALVAIPGIAKAVVSETLSLSETDNKNTDSICKALNADSNAHDEHANAKKKAHTTALAAVNEQLEKGAGSYLALLLRESVLLMEFLTSRLRREDVWGDAELLDRGLETPSQFELQAVVEVQRQILETARNLSVSITGGQQKEKEGGKTSCIADRLVTEVLQTVRQQAEC